jgi:hypothetical protein
MACCKIPSPENPLDQTIRDRTAFTWFHAAEEGNR